MKRRQVFVSELYLKDMILKVTPNKCTVTPQWQKQKYLFYKSFLIWDIEVKDFDCMYNLLLTVFRGREHRQYEHNK